MVPKAGHQSSPSLKGSCSRTFSRPFDGPSKLPNDPLSLPALYPSRSMRFYAHWKSFLPALTRGLAGYPKKDSQPRSSETRVTGSQISSQRSSSAHPVLPSTDISLPPEPYPTATFYNSGLGSPHSAQVDKRGPLAPADYRSARPLIPWGPFFEADVAMHPSIHQTLLTTSSPLTMDG